MEFPPSNWDIFPVEEFTTAAPRVNSDCSVELMAIVRPNGRVMDHWRMETGNGRHQAAEHHAGASFNHPGGSGPAQV